MTERAPALLDDSLKGIEWSEFEKSKPTIVRTLHGHSGLSVVDLAFEGKYYRITLDTKFLELDEAEAACANVPEWWDISKNTGALFTITGDEL